MALTRAKKQELAAGYSEGLASSPHAFLVSFGGISVNQVNDLRQKVREAGGHYAVVKNRVALRVIPGTPFEDLAEHFSGPTAVAYADEAPVAVAKALTEFAKEVPAIEFKAGILNGQAVAGEQIKEIANLPSREELIAKLVFLLQSPVARFVRGLGGIQQQFVSVLEQVRQKKEQEG
jgi:large subunit ribosomal protein L10